MTDPSNLEVEPGIPPNAVSVLGGGTEEFPVLKAFQQYIDAEQNKARKRMVSLSIFFGCLMTVVIVVFLVLLNGVSQRNQALNDKLFEYLVKDRDRQSSAVVVQPSADPSAVYGLAAKLEEIQKKLTETQQAELVRQQAEAKAEADAQAAAKASHEALEKARIREALEVERLKKELASERARAAQEREKKREAELEAYRRKHYPEFYEQKKRAQAEQEIDAELAALANGGDDESEEVEEEDEESPVNYFAEDDAEPLPRPSAKKTTRSPKNSAYSIPVEVKGTKTKWRIPKD